MTFSCLGRVENRGGRSASLTPFDRILVDTLSCNSPEAMTDRLLEQYEMGEEVGRGRFGTLRRCKNRETGEEFACKSIEKAEFEDDPTDGECIEKEMKFMRSVVGHGGVVELRAVYEDQHFIHLVMDLCSGGDLFQRILHKAKPFSEVQAAQLLKSLMEAVAHCHRMGIAHRDLKPDNILFPQPNSSFSQMKLSDFGHASSFSPGQPMKGIVGTPYYVAPEVLEGKEYDEKVDVWSAGVILYIMLAGRPPFWGETPQQIFESVMRDRLRFPSDVWHSVSPSAKDLIRRMLSRHVPYRLSADQVLRHPWITANAHEPGTADV